MNSKNLNSEKSQSNLPYKNCLNCGAELKGMYCHICGQQATSKTPTIVGFILEYLNNAFIWDPKFSQTLWNLIRRPGYLTNEYLAGKFTSQEHPLKLNMFLLFVFITLFVFFSGTEKMNNSVHSLTKDERVRSAIIFERLVDSEYAKKMEESQRDTVTLIAPLSLAEEHPEIISNLKTIKDTKGEGLDIWTAAIPRILIEDKIVQLDNRGSYRFNKKSKNGNNELEVFNSVWTEMVNIITQYFPILALFTAPLLSMSLCFVQRKNKLPRINHFIFSLHYIAFVEFLMMCIYLLYLVFTPSIDILNYIMIIGSCSYLTIAFRRVYNSGSWIKAILKALFTSLVYCIIGLFIFIGIFFVACFLVADKLSS